MVRRHSTKAKGHSKGHTKGTPRPTNRNDSKIKRWDKLADIPVDDEDQFHTSRGKILLEGDERDNDEDWDENEVFGLKGMSDDEVDEEEGEGDEDVGDLDDKGELLAQRNKMPKQKAKKKKGAESSGSSEESESEEETWGRSKSAYYSSNAADLESDDEEANELEEQEAKRLQAKTRETMVEDDFGLHDPVEVEPEKSETDALMEPMSPIPQALPQDLTLYIRHLEKTSPETLALARDWDDTIQSLTKAKQKIADLEVQEPDALNLGMTHLHYQALLTYATTLAFYLHLRSSEKYAKHPDMLKSHPILSRLLTLKQSLNTLEELDFAVSDEDEDSDNEMLLDAEQLWKLDCKTGLEPDELTDLLEDANKLMASSPQLPPTGEQPPKKKRRTTSTESRNPPRPVFDLVEPIFTSSKSSLAPARSDTGIMDPYGESTSLQHADAADKSARKKTLRFHTAKIESASARRQGARTNAVGGDDDLPYRERRKEKEIRLAKEANAKVRGQGGEDLNDVEPEVRQQQKGDGDSGDGEAEDADGYYELVKKKSREKKVQKKAEYEAGQAAARPDFDDVDTASGPRSLTRAILANKGLTPHRSKSVRNPRVKKRLKFEKAKKKVSSQKAVYKGGISDTGRYDGEKSGISKVVKSVRLA